MSEEIRTTILDALRKLITRCENKPKRMQTPTSTRYRLRASELARRAENQPDAGRMLKLMQEALGWLTLAENEESLAEGQDHSS